MINTKILLAQDVFGNVREGSQARSTAPDSGSGLIGVLGFESLPSHFLLFLDVTTVPKRIYS